MRHLVRVESVASRVIEVEAGDSLDVLNMAIVRQHEGYDGSLGEIARCSATIVDDEYEV